MKHPLAHRFRAALGGAIWGYAHASPQSRLQAASPFIHWAKLAESRPANAEALWQQSEGSPLAFLVALLPLLLAYSDDSATLQGWLAPLPRTAAATTAAAGATVLHYLVDAVISERPTVLPAGLSHPQLSAYLDNASAYYTSGAGIVQVKATLEQVARDRADSTTASAPQSGVGPAAGPNAGPVATQSAIALTLALYSALRTPEQIEIACRCVATAVDTEDASSAAAIAGYLCGLQQGLSGVSLECYQSLDEALPIPRDQPQPLVTANQLSQVLLALWSGATQPHTDSVAIAAPDIGRASGTNGPY